MLGRRFAALLLGGMVALSSCAMAQDTPEATQEPVVAPDYVMMGLELDSSGRKWEENNFFAVMQERTGISFEYRQYTDQATYQQAKDLAFASGDLPDVFFKAALTATEQANYLASGQLIDLTPYIASDAPALQSILDARDDWKQAITLPEGGIAALPSLNGYERQVYIWVNKTWMDALDISMPTDIASYEELLRAFATKDPNGNGKSDELPLSFVGPWESRYFLHAFGLTPNDYNIYVDDNGTVVFAPFEDNYREFIQWLGRMNTEGLLDSGAFRQSQAARTTTLSELSDLVMGSLVSMAPYTLVDLTKSVDYVVMPPLEYEGTSQYRRFLTGVVRGTYAITSACENPAELMQWVDYLYTDEGGKFAVSGIVDEDYAWTENGTWAWITDDFTYVTDILQNRVIRTDLTTPGLDPADFQQRTDIQAEANARRQGNAIQGSLVQPFPVYWPLNEAREDEIAQLQYELGQCVDRAIAQFATGEIVLDDASWAAFHAQLKELGVDRFVALWQEIYDETLKLQ